MLCQWHNIPFAVIVILINGYQEMPERIRQFDASVVVQATYYMSWTRIIKHMFTQILNVLLKYIGLVDRFDLMDDDKE